jgi:hypothetical protein
MLNNGGSFTDMLNRGDLFLDMLNKGSYFTRMSNRGGSCIGILNRGGSCIGILNRSGFCTDMLNRDGFCTGNEHRILKDAASFLTSSELLTSQKVSANFSKSLCSVPVGNFNNSQQFLFLNLTAFMSEYDMRRDFL